MCKKHSSTSIIKSTPKVTAIKGYQITKEPIVSAPVEALDPNLCHGTIRISCRNTRASWEWASERAQRRKYDAVFETVPRTNSMVSMS